MNRLVLGGATALALCLAGQAQAGITCNLTDKQGHSLQYSFARGGEGYTNEIVVKRDGAVLSNGGPVWTRVSDNANQSMTLWQGDWSIAYPYDPNKGYESVLRFRNRKMATGVCEADYAVDSPQAPVEASAPQQPLPIPDAPVASSSGAAPGSLSTYLGM